MPDMYANSPKHLPKSAKKERTKAQKAKNLFTFPRGPGIFPARSKHSLGYQVSKGKSRFEVLVRDPSMRMANRATHNYFLTDRDRIAAEMKASARARERSAERRKHRKNGATFPKR